MSKWLVRVFDHNKKGQPSESSYFISEPNETETILTAYDVHYLSKDLHGGTDDVPNVELEEAQDVPGGSWISNFFGKL